MIECLCATCITIMIYLDNNATTRVDDRVFDAMLPFLKDVYGNPSSPCTFSRKPALAIDHARHQVAASIDADPSQIIFTSGGTESNHLGIHALLQQADAERRTIVVSPMEHPSIRNLMPTLERKGYKIVRPGVDRDGRPLPGSLESAIDETTALVIWMSANNETGTVFDKKMVGALCNDFHVKLYSDCSQSLGKHAISITRDGCDGAGFCAHKLHGPKGVGALYLRDPSGVEGLFAGGDQERGIRPGTEPVSLIVGMGEAAVIATNMIHQAGTLMAGLRDRWEATIQAALPDVVVIGSGVDRLPNTSLMIIPGCSTEGLLARLDMADVCVSSGSACTSGSHEVSHVLTAMGWRKEAEQGAVVRMSLSRFTTGDEIHDAAIRLVEAVTALRTKQAGSPI